MTERACDACLARSWLLGTARRTPRQCAWPDRTAARARRRCADRGGRRAATGARGTRVRGRGPRSRSRSRARAAGLRHRVRAAMRRIRRGLRELAAPPAVLHVAGGLERLVRLTRRRSGRRSSARGRRRRTGWRSRSRSGGGSRSPGSRSSAAWRHGIDAAAHARRAGGWPPHGRGACRVRPTGPTRRQARPARADRRHRRRAVRTRAGDAASGAGCFQPATASSRRSSAMTVVVEAGERSGSLITARMAHGIGRPVGAVPGRVTTPQAAGPNGLLASGACIVREPQDVLDRPVRGGCADRRWRDPRATARRASPSVDCDRRGPRDQRRAGTGRVCARPGPGSRSRLSNSRGSSSAAPAADSGSPPDATDVSRDIRGFCRSHRVGVRS